MARSKRVLIVGGVAAGPKVASRLMRVEPHTEVTIIERGVFLSYAGCGLPHYVAGDVATQTELMCTPLGVVRDAVFFRETKRLTVHNRTEALRIERARNALLVRDLESRDERWLEYDKLVLCTGGRPVMPDPLPGTDLPQVFSLHGVEDAEGIKESLTDERARDVVIIGGGLIGIEMTEALVRKGCRVTIVEARDHILNLLDPEMAALVARHLESNGVRILTRAHPHSIQPEDGKVAAVRLIDGRMLPADMVILAAGVQPACRLAADAGLEIGETGGIVVNETLRTSDHDIYAAGDCVETRHLVTGHPYYMPMGSTANKMGRVVANAICGVPDHFPGVVGSAICKVFDYNVARTGLSEQEAREAGFDVTTVLAPGPDRPHFMPDSAPLLIKLVVDVGSRRLLGAQVIGPGEADRRVDVAAMAVAAHQTVDELANADLTYAPPYSPAMDNLITACNVARNKLDGLFHGVAPEEVHERIAEGDVFLLDVRMPEEVVEQPFPGAVNIPLSQLRDRLAEVPRDRDVVAFCRISLRGYEAALILQAAGCRRVHVLDGGVLNWPYALEAAR
jgi:NADPH-dependent 2,4-dienoyl-CoA reductase/sulfur reductase-like enzyme/rhodanese-related sulfurtransferase